MIGDHLHKCKIDNMTVLMKRSDTLYDVVSFQPIQVGDSFDTFVKEKMVTNEVMVIEEQRKEKGTFADETNRKWWARVQTKIKAKV